jgi:hypothetical protein
VQEQGKGGFGDGEEGILEFLLAGVLKKIG